MTRIAIFHELHAGGARRAVNEFAKCLKKNHQVDLYIVDEKDNKLEKDFFSNGFYYRFTPKKWSGGNWKIKLYKDTVELSKLYNLHKKIAKDINAQKYDITFIHPSQYTQAPFILRFITTKKIYYCQEPLRISYEPGFDIPSNLSLPKKIYEKTIRRIRKKIDKENIACADIILSNSKYTQQNIENAYGLKSTVSYLGVDTETFKPSGTKKDADILFIGAKGDIDGLPLLEEAISYMKKKPKIKIHINEKNWIDDKDLSRLYTSARIVVCLARKEPFGLIPLEAMACGVPVIAVNEGGYKETVIDGQTGYLVSRDPKSLTDKLEFLLSNEKICAKMGENARRHIEQNWTWDKSVKNLENILRNINRKLS